MRVQLRSTLYYCISSGTIMYQGRFPLRKISIGSDRTALFSSCIIRSAEPKKLKILQLFICGSQVQTGTENWYRKPMLGFNFVPIRSDPMLIFLSGNRPLVGGQSVVIRTKNVHSLRDKLGPFYNVEFLWCQMQFKQ